MSDTIEVQKWVKRGSMLYNTECLDYDDPMHPYNQVKSQGLVPEDFGLYNPLNAEFDKKSRYDLIDEILYLRKEVNAMAAAGF